MAIYHLSVQVISRGQGRSGVAAAAYRAGAKLDDARQGLTHDYTRRSDVRETWIQAPKEAPTWVTDRQTLWTAIDAAEKRKDAQTAREVTVALPRELTPAQQREAVHEFVQAAFIERGMVADVALHEGHNDQEPNPHAHILLTTRTLTADGFGPKNRDWNAKDLLVTWRTQWEVTCNEALEEAKQTVRIDARSLAAQGVTDRLPTVHEGVAVRQMERRGHQTDRGDINRAVRAHQTAVVDLAEVRQARSALRSLQPQLDHAEAWRGQAGWPEPARQRLRGWEEQAGRVLTRTEVTQWVQAAQDEVSRAKATEQEALRLVQVSEPGPLQRTQTQLMAVVQQAQEAQARLQDDFSGLRGWWTRWRNPREYQTLQDRVEKRPWAEAQLQALQAPWAAQEALATQNQAACQAARATREAVEAKLARWQSLLDQPWTPAEQAEMKAKAQAPKKPNPQRQGPSQPLSPTEAVTIRTVDSHGRERVPTPPPPKRPRPARDGQDRGYSR